MVLYCDGFAYPDKGLQHSESIHATLTSTCSNTKLFADGRTAARAHAAFGGAGEKDAGALFFARTIGQHAQVKGKSPARVAGAHIGLQTETRHRSRIRWRAVSHIARLELGRISLLWEGRERVAKTRARRDIN